MSTEADKQQYGLLAEKIHTLEATNVDVKLPQEEAKLQGMVQSLGAYTQALQQSSKQLQKEKADAEEMEKSKLRRKLLGSKFDKMAEKEQAEYRDAMAKFKTVEEKASQVQQAVTAQTAVVEELRKTATQLEAARVCMKELVGKVFSGAAGDASENELERQVAALGPKKEQIIAEARNLGVAGQYLQSALKQLNDAFRQLQVGHQLNGMDVAGNFMGPGGGGNPGGFMGDMMERQSIKAAGQLVAGAMSNIQQAYQAAPGLPPIRAGQLDNMKVFGSHLIGGAVFDMAKQQKIQQGLMQIRTMQADVQRGLGWLQAEQAQINARVAAVQEEHRRKDNELMKARMALMAAGHGGTVANV